MFDRGASPPVQAQGPFQGQRPRVRSPGPQSPNNPAPTRFAPRKSSLGQHDAPADSPYFPIHADSGRQMGSRPGSRQANESAIMSPNKPWMVEGTVGGPRSASPSGSMRSPTATGNPLPFVRPADIYKKLEDEKEKVRRSIDSGRPSMDSLGLGRGSEKAGSLRTQSPAGTSQNARTSQEQGQVRPDSDVISPGLARAVNAPGEEEGEVDAKGRKGTAPGRDDDDTISPRGPRTGLPTVAERKSEYGIEGLIASYEARGGASEGASPADERPLAQTAEVTSVPSSRDAAVAVASPESRLNSRSEAGEDRGQQVHNAPGTSDFEKREGAGRKEDSGSGHLRSNEAKQASEGGGRSVGVEAPNQVQSGEELRRLSTSPKLPELGRLSVFGFDLFSSSTSSDPQNSSSFNNHNPTSSPPPPVPTIPHSHSHTIVSPTSPLSTVIESPSPTSPLSGIQNADGVQQTSQAQGQGQGEPASADGRSVPGTQLPSASYTLSQPNSSRDPEPDSSQVQSFAGDRAQEESPQRPQSGSETVTVLHSRPNTVTSLAARHLFSYSHCRIGERLV
ncbi:hypothetical protein GE09DRAFT_1129617 [Coniochaeta sp. 2T2.1]|nr:hypothetical protein GE09DRAFT_1129617 [Coniochaeta sp. 2T2.1]